MKPLEVYREAQRLGFRLEPAGDQLLVFGDHCPPDCAAELRQHKTELMALLEGEGVELMPDCAAWLPVTRQVLCGEFDGCDRSTSKSLIIGLRSIPRPPCQRALNHLKLSRKES